MNAWMIRKQKHVSAVFDTLRLVHLYQSNWNKARTWTGIAVVDHNVTIQKLEGSKIPSQ